MKEFFKFMFASMLGFLLTCVILFFVMLLIISSAISMGKKEVVIVPENSVLHMKLTQPVPERTPKIPDFFSLMDPEMEKTLGLKDLLGNIEKAKNDDHIKGIYLDLSIIPAGFSALDDIRSGLIDFKESGKFIICYGDMMTQSAYYLATVADKIYVNPNGLMIFKGLGAELMFFKGTLDKLDIDIQIIRPEGNKFKSAVEPFFLEKMSEANRMQYDRLIRSIWDYVVEQIASSRNITSETINEVADQLLIREPADAVKYGFINDIKYEDEIYAEIKTLLGLEEKDKIRFITMEKYLDAPSGEKIKFTRDKIAVVYAVGEIQMGEGDDQTIGADRIAGAIKKARLDTNIRAIVFRVNSPGGDALASDIILREIMLAKEIKPVIASYGNVAASGGYWISCQADKIIANKNSITGSIGVFGLLPNMQGFFNDKLGITFDHVYSNDNSGFPSFSRPMNSTEKEVMQYYVEDVYQTFLEYVSESRKMTTEQVDSIGQGRVWSGTDALNIGLIDGFGNLNDAIKIAAEIAGIEEYKVTELPKLKDPLQELLDGIMGQKSQMVLQKELGENYTYLKHLQSVTRMKGIQARMPVGIEIK